MKMGAEYTSLCTTGLSFLYPISGCISLLCKPLSVCKMSQYIELLCSLLLNKLWEWNTLLYIRWLIISSSAFRMSASLFTKVFRVCSEPTYRTTLLPFFERKMKGRCNMKRVICTMCLLLVLLVSGCSWSSDEKINTEPKPESIKSHYNY